MENYSDDVFEFGNKSNEDLEQTSNFDYDSLSGLGESNYENEDLFNDEVSGLDNYSSDSSNFDFGVDNYTDLDNKNYQNYSEDYLNSVVSNSNDESMQNAYKNSNSNVDDSNENKDLKEENATLDEDVPFASEYKIDDEAPSLNESEDSTLENASIVDNSSELPIDDVDTKDNSNNTDTVSKQQETHEDISLSETPIEELNKLTEYKEDKIDATDISDLFNKVTVNVKDASEIFKKNTDLKQKIDSRFDELKKLQSEIENSRKTQIDEINQYKDEVFQKLTEKKEEIEKRLNLLKESQADLEKERQEFEQYKKTEQENIDKIQKEIQTSYDDRREELSHIEDVLRKQKDALDEERNQLSLDKIQYEADKNELANNLLKFNDLVNSFTSGVEETKGE